MSKQGHNADTQQKVRAELGKIFTPSKPITDPALFSGRTELLKDLTNQLDIPGKVLILYGDRGVGKTSFCNVLLHGRRPHTYNCTKEDDFVSIFLNVLRDLNQHLTDEELSEGTTFGVEAGVAGVKASVADTVSSKLKPIGDERLDQAGVLRRLKDINPMVDTLVFDEAQNLSGHALHRQLNSLLKGFSDNNIGIQVVFVGIAHSDEELLPRDPAYNDYKLRHYTTARIPPMTLAEIEDIIDRRQRFKISFGEKDKKDLATVSGGYPFIAHTLALYATFAWLTENGAKLLTNWLIKLPFFGKWLGSDVKVANIDMSVTRNHLLEGFRMFLVEFGRNYPTEAAQLRVAYSPGQTQRRELLELLLRTPHGWVSRKDLEAGLRITRSALSSLLKSVEPLVIHNRDEDARAPYPAAVRIWSLLQSERPEALDALAIGAATPALHAPPAGSESRSMTVKPKGDRKKNRKH
jgi:hypothetical protein